MADFLKSLPTVDQLLADPSGDTLLYSGGVIYSGAMTNPTTLTGPVNLNGHFIRGAVDMYYAGALASTSIPTMVGTFGTVIENTFSGALTLIPVTLSGSMSEVRWFVSAMTLPAPGTISSLISDPTDDDLLSDPTADNLQSTGFLAGNFVISTSYSGDLTLGPATLAGLFAITTADFAGGLTLGATTLTGLYSAPTVDYSGNLDLAAITLAGIFGTSHPFTGSLILPATTLEGVHTGSGPLFTGDGIAFMNTLGSNFDTTRLNDYFDSIWPPGTGEAGYGPYDTVNARTGAPIETGDQRSVSVRAPLLGNRRTPIIKPIIKTAYSGKRRSSINSPIYVDISLSWSLIGCDDAFLNSLLGLLYFEQIDYSFNNESYRCVLLSDVVSVVNSARNKTSITLNFRGYKL